MRETKEDWLELGRDLTARGLPAPRLVVADGAAGLPSAVEEIWPRADRQHCAVHRLRNLLAKVPKTEQDRIRFNYWSALTDATSVKDGKLRLQVLISELEHGGYESAARCLSDDLDALVVHLRYPLRHRERWRSTNLLERSLGEVRRAHQSDGPLPRRDQLPYHSSGPYSTCSSATPATAPPSPTSTAHTSTESNTSKPTPTPSTRRSQPLRLNPGNLNRERIYSGKWTRPIPSAVPAPRGKREPPCRRRSAPTGASSPPAGRADRRKQSGVAGGCLRKIVDLHVCRTTRTSPIRSWAVGWRKTNGIVASRCLRASVIAGVAIHPVTSAARPASAHGLMLWEVPVSGW